MKNRTLVLAAALVTLSCAACARSPRAEQNSNTANANASTPEQAAAQAVAASPYFKQTVRGDIERAGLEIERALSAARIADWQNASADLKNATNHIEIGLGRNPRYSQREDLEGLKAAIDRAIQSVEGRNKEASSQIAELRTRVMGLKVQIPDL